MNLAELRKKLQEILKRLKAFRALDADKRTEELQTQRKADMAESITIETEIRELEEEAALEARMGRSINDPPPADDPGDDDSSNIAVQDQPIYRGSSASVLGQQLLDIRTMSQPVAFEDKEVVEARTRLMETEKRNSEKQEKRLRKENRVAATGGFTVGVPTDGGFFLQGESAVELMTHGFNNSEVLSRTSNRTLGEGTQFVEIYGIDEESRANGSRGGGVRVYTTAELASFTVSKTKFKKIRIEPTKLTGLYYASGEIIRNVTFLGQEMRDLFGKEFAFKGQDLVINGSGGGEALGILNADCLISITKETGQAADTILTNNILKMEARLWAENPSVVYLVNRETKPQLSLLSHAIGSGGVLIPLYKADFYGGKRVATLNGFPCITIEQAAALGDKGDIILADLSQYITANKGDINEAMSIHVNFIYDQDTFRFLWYFDGQPRWANKLTPYKGSDTVGPFLVTAAR